VGDPADIISAMRSDVVPDIRYARSGGVAVAYQVVGQGSQELVFVPFLSSLISIWELPAMRDFFDRLAVETRLTILNPRGMGLSDRPRNVTLEDWAADVLAVLDAQEIERASFFATGDSANACLLLAASFPERVDRLVLLSPFARRIRGGDYEIGTPEDDLLAFLRTVRNHWGEREFMRELASEINPQWADDEEYLDWFVWNHRQSSSPASAAEFWRMQIGTDITDVLGSVRVPTLVLHRRANTATAEYVSERISGSTLVEVPGEGGTPATGPIIEAALAFVRGEVAHATPDTILATLLFTDLVGSTALAAELGDRRWREILESHHQAVRREVARHRGTIVDSAGDGFFCRFDGPARALSCAREILASGPALGLAVRAGVHTGECELSGDKPVGLAVVIAARIAALAGTGEVLVSQTVTDLVAGSDLAFEERGSHELKGVPGKWRIHALRE
jgi:class 3 adenylate cyclase/pimeloyl-ACP methyl ester carboxylesterase